MGSGLDAGLERVARSLDWLHERTKGYRLRICLENTAGQGTVLGAPFEHLGRIFGEVKEPERLGVCLDTCHAFAAGYDLRRGEGYEAALEELESFLGRDRVCAVHVNDARGELGSRLDRHAHPGRGKLGLECFRLIMNDPRLSKVPKVLETPKEDEGLNMDRVNLWVLRALTGVARVPPRLLERSLDAAVA